MSFRAILLAGCLTLACGTAFGATRKPLVLNSGQQQQLQSGDVLGDSSGNAYGFGSVTSVGLSLPTQFTCTGSPITTSGSFSCSWGTESANTVFAGPSSGSAAAPTFRGLVLADLPSIAFSNLTGSATATQLPTATAGALGIMEVGTGLSVSAGVVSVTNPSPGTSVSGDLPKFSNTTGALADSGTLLSSLLTSATAASTYLPLTGGALTGTLTGAQTYSSSTSGVGVGTNASDGYEVMITSGASANAKIYDWYNDNSGTLHGRMLLDNQTNANEWFNIVRSGDTPGTLTFDEAVAATSFSGSGASLTSLPGAQLSGHVSGGSGAPTLGSCGSGSPALGTGATDSAGIITTGTSTTSCALSFGTAFTNKAACVFTDLTATANITSVAETVSGFTLTMTSNSGNEVHYACPGK